MISSSDRNCNREVKSQFSIIFVLVSQYRSHSVLLNSAVHVFCPWVRGGCIACSRGRGGFQCGEEVYPNNHAQSTIEILQLLGQFGILDISCFYGFSITLSLVHVCIHFEIPVLNVIR